VRQETTAVESEHASRWGSFLAWLAVGGCLTLGLAALLSVGAVLIGLALAGGLFLLRGRRRNAVAGCLAGTALPLFYLAWLNRGGPGTVCRATTGGRSCTDEYPPIPFLLAGVLSLAAGLLLFLVLDRGRRTKG
jgi:Na+/proline symporter